MNLKKSIANGFAESFCKQCEQGIVADWKRRIHESPLLVAEKVPSPSADQSRSSSANQSRSHPHPSSSQSSLQSSSQPSSSLQSSSQPSSSLQSSQPLLDSHHPPRPLRLISPPRPLPPLPKPSFKPKPSLPPPPAPLRLSIPPPAPLSHLQPLKLRVEPPQPSMIRRDRVPSLQLRTCRLLEEEFREVREGAAGRESKELSSSRALSSKELSTLRESSSRQSLSSSKQSSSSSKQSSSSLSSQESTTRLPRVKKPRARKRIARNEKATLAKEIAQRTSETSSANSQHTNATDPFNKVESTHTDFIEPSNNLLGNTQSNNTPISNPNAPETTPLSAWSEKQTKQLETAIRTVALPIDSPLFWTQVSLRVSDRSAEECQQKSEAMGLRPPQSKKRSQNRQQSNGLVAIQLPRHR